ncbi:MAG: fructosamine kinase family protein [Bacteroidota bacterium]
MIYDEELDFLEKVLLIATGMPSAVKNLQFISGGFVNQAVSIDTDVGKFFVKFNESQPESMFSAEASGLNFLREKLQHVAVIPEVIYFGEILGRHVMVLEYIQDRIEKPIYWKNLGETIATLHHISHHKAGLHFHNFAGPLAQNNLENSNWSTFFFEKRLNVQFGLAFYNELITKSYLKQLELLQPIFEKLYEKEPFSLLHGDFWKGNVFPAKNNQPCLFDPAIYFGHREVDIATAGLFGGFDETFFESYQNAFPFLPGSKERMEIYSLYPLMLYVNLYGTSYMSRIDKILGKYI